MSAFIVVSMVRKRTFTNFLLLCLFSPLIALAEPEKGQLESYVSYLTSIDSRKAGTPGNAQATEWIINQLTGWGYHPIRQCFGPNSCNIIADKLRSGTSNRTVLAITHFDSAGMPFAGADDNASGSAALLETARILSQISLEHGVRFVFFNGEEDGFVGSSYYIEHSSGEELANIRFVIDLDMVGFSPSKDIEIASDDQQWLLEELSHKARQNTGLEPKQSAVLMASDFLPFQMKQVPTVLVTEPWHSNPCYHESCDTASTINYNYLTEVTLLTIAALLP